MGGGMNGKHDDFTNAAYIGMDVHFHFRPLLDFIG